MEQTMIRDVIPIDERFQNRYKSWRAGKLWAVVAYRRLGGAYRRLCDSCQLLVAVKHCQLATNSWQLSQFSQ